MSTIELIFETAIPIAQADIGLSEPSGLAFAPDGSLWTVSDDTRKLFRIDTRGRLLQELSIGNRGLEGLTVDRDGRIWAVDEDSGKVLTIDPTSGRQLLERRLKDIDGFCAIERHFEHDANKGLEGIAFDPIRAEILLLKEAKPGLLIAVTEDLRRIVSVDWLGEPNGFVDDDVAEDELDFSGICYDARDDLFWIVSDQGRRVYTFDRRSGRTVQSAALTCGPSDRAIRKAEGVALDAVSRRLYVVSDRDAELYVFRISD